MKKYLILYTLTILLLGCKNDEPLNLEQQQVEQQQLYQQQVEQLISNANEIANRSDLFEALEIEGACMDFYDLSQAGIQVLLNNVDTNIIEGIVEIGVPQHHSKSAEYKFEDLAIAEYVSQNEIKYEIIKDEKFPNGDFKIRKHIFKRNNKNKIMYSFSFYQEKPYVYVIANNIPY